MMVALLALFVALGSGSYAAVKLSRNVVKSRNIAPNAVKSSDIAPDAATGADVLESTFGKVPDADRLDGVDSAQLPRVFSGRVALTPATPDQAVMFSVPELGVSVLADNFVSTEGGLRVKNTGTSASIVVADHSAIDNGTTVAPGAIFPSGAGQGIPISKTPVTVTLAGSNSGPILTIFCSVGGGGANCTGLLAGAS